MKIMDLEIDIKRLSDKIKKQGFKHVGLQFPEGVKPYAFNLIEKLKEIPGLSDIRYTVSGAPCFGACDTVVEDFQNAGADVVFHFGHSEIPSMEKPSLISLNFIEMHSTTDVLPAVEKALGKINLKGKIALTSNTQYVHQLPGLKKFLEKKGYVMEIGKGGRRISHDGQVLGCCFSSASVVHDSGFNLFIGEGDFHPLGISLASKKPVIAVDPRTGEVREMEEERQKVLRQRYAAIQNLKRVKDITLVMSTLPGQKREKYTTKLEKIGREYGKNMYVVTVGHIDLDGLKNLGVKTVVSTACPRIAIDDYSLFLENGITVTTPIEFLISLGLMDWDNYIFDTFE